MDTHTQKKKKNVENLKLHNENILRMSDIYLEVIKTLTVVKARKGMKTIKGGSVNLICNKEKS